ncbi:MAG: hypothetical protein JJU32_12465 [Phormidium sp. BM_Day4_Bin.17]|nr:hypothetical protein [Phormidium sp. BM_Day4_Bin.17]UCJ13739.1 MAG: hypothetical protein JWS08_08355 [Phormidium sp. PBR-2020]
MANPLNNGLVFKICILAGCQFASLSSLPPDVGTAVQNLGSAVVSVADDRTFRGWFDRFSSRKKDEDDEQEQEETTGLPDNEEAEEEDDDNNSSEDSEDCSEGEEDENEIEN